MSKLNAIEDDAFEEGRYRVLYDYAPEEDMVDGLTVKEKMVVNLQAQAAENGWVWATVLDKDNPTAAPKSGFLPKGFIVKIPGYDRWAYGAEVTCIWYTFLTGLFVTLYGSSEIDGTRNLAFGCLSMIASGFLMIMVQFRDSLGPLKRMLGLFFCGIFMFAGYPTGIWGGIVVLFACVVEFIVYQEENVDVYIPEPLKFDGCCDFWRSSGFSIFFFLLWCGCNFAVFLLGLEFGYRRAEDWQADGYEIQKGEWAFAQASGTLIAWNILVMLLFCLQGFQQIMLSSAERITSNTVGKKADFKKFIINHLQPESMLYAHRCIAFTLICSTILHLLGCFAAYEHSGPERDFMEIFGEAPFITGGICISILGIVMSSSYLDIVANRDLFRNIHHLALVAIILLIFHGADWWNPNMWKYLIGPTFLYCLDKVFRYGVFGYSESEDYDALKQENKA